MPVVASGTANSQRGIEETTNGGHNPALAEQGSGNGYGAEPTAINVSNSGKPEKRAPGADGMVTALGRDSLFRLDKPSSAVVLDFLELRLRVWFFRRDALRVMPLGV